MENEEKVVDATESTEVLELENELGDTEDIEAIKKELADALEAKRQLTARAKTAEAKLKEKPEPTQINNNGLSADDVDVKILQSQGLDEDAIKYLKKLAQVNGTSIIAAQSDELFEAYKTKKETEEKTKKASLGASRGSGQAKKEASMTTPGLSDADHKALWNKQNGR